MARLTVISGHELEATVTRDPRLLLLHFSSGLASSCELVHRELVEMAADLPDSMALVEVEVPLQNLELLEKFGIESLPTISLYQGGKEVERLERLMLGDELREYVAMCVSFYCAVKTPSQDRS